MSDSSDFDEMIKASGMDVDDGIVKKVAVLEAQIRCYQAAIDAHRAEIEQLTLSPEENNCNILPEHFVPNGDRVDFCAPEAERIKMRRMIAGTWLTTLRTSMMAMSAASIAKSGGEGDEDEDLEEGSELGRIQEFLARMLSESLDVPTVETVKETLFAESLSVGEAKCWKLLYAQWARFADSEDDQRELGALVERLAVCCAE